MNLTVQNYHSPEANREYMSVHQFNNWMDCPARTKAELAGEWYRGDIEAFEIGCYIDCALLTPTALQDWWNCHLNAMIGVGLLSKAKTTYGAKLAKMIYADAMIARAQSLPDVVEALKGDPQPIFTAELFGFKWRCMVDCYRREQNKLTDLKSSKSITGMNWFDRDTIFDYLDDMAGRNRWRGDFLDEYNYWRQLAVYRRVVSIALEVEQPDPWIVAISKEHLPAHSDSVPDSEQIPVGIYHMADERAMNTELEFIEEVMPHVIGWKLGYMEAPHCEHCAFCASKHPVVKREVYSSYRRVS